MYRARFAEEIVAEFLPPAKRQKKERVIVLCDGMPSMPRKQGLVEWLAGKGYWVFYPRYRGAWESGGQFLAKSPEQDILDVVRGLPGGFCEAAFGKRFAVEPDETFVIGGSFGGATAVMASLSPLVTKAVANCAVVDWSILHDEQVKETSNPSYAAYIRDAFGEGYRLSDRKWDRLKRGDFFNPVRHIESVDAKKLMMFHAKDDPYVPYSVTKSFCEATGVKLHSLRTGGHLSTEWVTRRFWREIEQFLRQ